MVPESISKIHPLRLNLVLLEEQIVMLRTGSGKFAVREISLAMHARVANPEGGQVPPLHLLNLSLNHKSR